MTMGMLDDFGEDLNNVDDTGYKNELVELSDEQLLQNIQQLQNENNIKMSNSLVKALGRCSLDIEMETGTGRHMFISKLCSNSIKDTVGASLLL